jgi:T5SS/PEP-CTERM-associated repeat protein
VWNVDIGTASYNGVVNLNTSAEVNDLTLGSGGGSGTLEVSGNSLTVDDTLQVGESGAGTGTLSISGSSGFGFFGGSGGTVQSGAAVIGDTNPSTGVVTVDGSNSTWTLGSGRNSADLTVGNNGTGTLTISGGASVSNNNGWVGNGSTGNGTVNVEGTGSTWSNSGTVYVGEGGTGSLTISNSDEHGFGSFNGASVSAANASIGDVAGSNGTVTVTGRGASLTIQGSGGFHPSGGNLTVGNAGTGTLTVESGASVSVSGTITVGESGTGTMNIGADPTSGNTVSSANGIIGDAHGSTGSVTLTGSGSQWNISGDHNSGSLEVGNAGTGTLTINAGTQVTDTTACIGCSAGGNGTVIVNGNGNANSAEWSTSQSLSVGVNGTGSLTIENGGLVYVGTPAEGRPGHFGYEPATVGTITIGANGTVILDGATVDSNIVNERGGILDPTATVINGSYAGEAGSTLVFDVYPGGNDTFDLGGPATFAPGSTIEIDFIDGATPTPGTNYTFFTGDTSGIDISSGVSFTVDVNGTPVSTPFSLSGGHVGIPEPGTWVLLITALIAMAAFAVRKRRAVLPDLAL